METSRPLIARWVFAQIGRTVDDQVAKQRAGAQRRCVLPSGFHLREFLISLRQAFGESLRTQSQIALVEAYFLLQLFRRLFSWWRYAPGSGG